MKSTLHLAIIMDGNGRWAEQRGQPRTYGHREGARAVARTVEAALEQRVTTLTLYAFSADNWRRPRAETRTLMSLFEDYLRGQTERCLEAGIRLRVVGRRDRLDESLIETIEGAEEATRHGDRLRLRIAIDYSARESFVEAARRLRRGMGDLAAFAREIEAALHDDEPVPDVDLLIRTGGERRLSDLFGWDCAYAELVFTDTMWPDFSAEDLAAALAEFEGRERRFGALPGVSLAAAYGLERFNGARMSPEPAGSS